MDLIIVESPTKAKTFAKILDKKKYQITSSMGHVRDLPEKKLGIQIKKDFAPEYQIMPKKKDLVNGLILLAKKAKRIILATDPDREGEAIAMHLETILKEKLKKSIKFERIVFHEITESALFEALKEPKEINKQLFNAQQARRILDRLVGYKISPYLWKSFSKRWLSAGRVQSVALRFLVERQKERNEFKSRKFFSIKGQFAIEKNQVIGKMTLLINKPFFVVNKLNLFDGYYQYQESVIHNEEDLISNKERLLKETYSVLDVSEVSTKRSPVPPFTTSSLQQYSVNNFGYSAKKTMQLAQGLYEQGLITYHRTDSFNLSEKFLIEAREFILKKYGKKYLFETTRRYKTKSKSAQEAHEAIRPTKLSNDINSSVILEKLNHDQIKLYEAIYNRSLATQMAEAIILKQKISIISSVKDLFQTEFEKVIFPGFLILEGRDNNKGIFVNNISNNTKATLLEIQTEEKQTLPPPSYSEASLIKTLEEKGIGRPSTYAPIISVLLERQYVVKDGRSLSAATLGIEVSDLLNKKFAEIFEIDFTASMEDKLDAIANGQEDWVKTVRHFYTPLEKQLVKALDKVEKIKVEEETKEKCPKCQSPLVIKISRFGKFFACSAFPDCKYTKSHLQGTGVICPKCSKGEVVIRFSRMRKRFYACNQYPECDYTSLWLNKKLENKTDSEKGQAEGEKGQAS